jgi:hypothetical protein
MERLNDGKYICLKKGGLSYLNQTGVDSKGNCVDKTMVKCNANGSPKYQGCEKSLAECPIRQLMFAF